MRKEIGVGANEQGITSSRSRYTTIPRTLSFVTYEDQVLLLRGAPGKRIWAGLYNGVGGHVEAGEDVLNSARREITEETGLVVHDLRLCGIISAATHDPNIGIVLFVFSGEAGHQSTRATAEGALEWFRRDQLPTENVMEDLPVLLGRIFSLRDGEQPFFGAYTYDTRDRLVMSFT